MTSASAPLSKILLVGDREQPAADARDRRPAVRRYRLARLHVNRTSR